MCNVTITKMLILNFINVLKRILIACLKYRYSELEFVTESLRLTYRFLLLSRLAGVEGSASIWVESTLGETKDCTSGVVGGATGVV